MNRLDSGNRELETETTGIHVKPKGRTDRKQLENVLCLSKTHTSIANAETRIIKGENALRHPSLKEDCQFMSVVVWGERINATENDSETRRSFRRAGPGINPQR